MAKLLSFSMYDIFDKNKVMYYALAMCNIKADV